MPPSPLAVIAVAVLLGTAGQVVASLVRLPAIVFLLIFGVAAGPHGLGLVNPDDLGSGLRVLVSAFVAIILFEGALTLRPDLLRPALVPVRWLITVGAAVTLVGAAVLAHVVAALPWSLAFLFASLIVVTGPTVIAPILRRVRLLPRLHAVLKSESILIDPVGVFVAAAIFQYVVGLATQEASWEEVAVGFLARFGIGAAVGGGAGLVAYLVGRFPVFHRRGNEHLVGLGAIGLALGTFALAEAFQPESGIMAVIVAGLLLAYLPVPFRTELETFKDQVTILGVSVLFILLSANLNLPLVWHTGWGEVVLLAGLIFVVRPASVFLATAWTDLTWREKAYLSLLAPRGILAAAMASYFADELRHHGLPGANRIELLAFFTIAATVLLQGSWAGLLARLLRVQPVRPEGVVLVGVNEWSLLLADLLQGRGQAVVLLDNNPARCEAARSAGLPVVAADATSPATYEGLDLSAFGVLVGLTPNDAVNTLACDAARGWLDDEVYQVVTKPIHDTSRSRVRMGGRWALPTHRSHAEVVAALGDGRLRLAEVPCERPTTIRAEMATPEGPLVPLLVVEAGRVGVAVEGRTCPAGAVLVGLVSTGA